ncbi:TRP-domain-containing protein [Cucurbitaria berberidis CBS 394.84]|uniref:TRP-domain-containing protein n=1 Tax=Cucurbitaria berberidis CBS 394.84 TaxID=1168544 RepID=A0A9P4GS62_9PLEO|nr:TRP-domain-containing protein [Cucurbitaria berberidis CBS 394.84]KAF1851748.1 TRP-domain-containing protein [Cucurbitaria berberidis CBS 394.84]
MFSTVSFKSSFVFLLILLSLVHTGLADEPQYVVAIIDGQRMRVRDDRKPALYTADYGDCLGESAINVTRFDAAYYKDNMTIIFHLAGETALTNETIMMYIGVYAYGENRFDLTFNPCSANIESACPVKAGTPIEAAGIIPISQHDVAGIPKLALSIPDFEGEAILRLFSNSTQTEIGCFTAQITNGNTFQQKVAVGSVLGAFTFVAALSSFATAIYGEDIAVIRKHYAHSLSFQVVFAVWHHIFYSGALSMNWPSVLVAFWNNYAWAGGMIYSESMQNSINDFVGVNKGNISHVGAAGTGVSNPSLGGGYDIHQIYKRGILSKDLSIQNRVSKRHLVDTTSGFKYDGQPVKPGLPLPGNYSGFAGTLSQERIPASNAFMTGLLWFLALLAGIAVAIVVLRVSLEGLSRTQLIKQNHLALFKAYYLGYTAAALLRTLFIGFFMMTFLAMFHISYLATLGPVAVACVVLIGMVFGLGAVGGMACYYRMTGTKSMHGDEGYIRHFGWLTSRYRRTRWWFFVLWIVYDFVRACLLAGLSSRPTIQVFGLLAVEFIAFVSVIFLRPFESQRLNVVVIYFLGFSKLATVALSATFNTRFNLPRIPATVIGLIIIVIQGLLTIVVMIAIVIGAITSYMSVMRNREEIKPAQWNSIREKYFENMDFRAQDIPRPRPAPVESIPEVTNGPYFNVRHVKRMAKVEDEDAEFMEEIYNNPSVSQLSLWGHNRPGFADLPSPRGRAASIQSTTSHSSLPKAARLHRASWSSQSYGGSQRPGRVRTVSNTMSTPSRPNRPSTRSRPRQYTQLGSLEDLDREPSPRHAAASQSSTPTISPASRSSRDTAMASSGARAVSRLASRSRSSSRPNLVTRISEEIPPLPENSGERETTKRQRASGITKAMRQ